jgi:hypothetical protein
MRYPTLITNALFGSQQHQMVVSEAWLTCQSVVTGTGTRVLKLETGDTLGPLNIRALKIFLGCASPRLMDLLTYKIRRECLNIYRSYGTRSGHSGSDLKVYHLYLAVKHTSLDSTSDRLRSWWLKVHAWHGMPYSWWLKVHAWHGMPHSTRGHIDHRTWTSLPRPKNAETTQTNLV